METSIVKASDYGLEQAKAETLTIGLNVTIEERKLLITEFETVSKLEVTEENLPKFKELRLKIVKNRTQGINAWHTKSKEYFLTGGKFVDAIKNKENAINTEMESKLMEGEKFFERQEAERIAKLELSRTEEVNKYSEIVPAGIGAWQEEVFNDYVFGIKAKHEAQVKEDLRIKEEADAKFEKEELKTKRVNQVSRLVDFIEDYDNINFAELSDVVYKKVCDNAIAKRTKHEAEQERIKLDNIRLKKEAKAKEAKEEEEKKAREKKEADAKIKHDAELKKAKDEKEKLQKELEAKAEKEKLERERLAKIESDKLAAVQAELKDKADKEAEDQAKEEARIQSELNKGDAAKINDLAADLEALKTKYDFKSAKNQAKYKSVGELLDKVIVYAKK